MGEWLETKPDLKKAIEIKRIIKTLRSRLRHRLADKKDLEEVGLTNNESVYWVVDLLKKKMFLCCTLMN